MKLTKIRGVKDIFDNEAEIFTKVLEEITHFSRNYNYQKIILPILEYSEVFYRTLGVNSDILTKETYTFLDREKRSLTLRPEFTAAIIRASMDNNLLQNLPLKLFTYGPLFRHERPQKCRLRQFHQYNFEYIGSKSFMVDIELLQLAQSIVEHYKLNNSVHLKINHLGNKITRNKYIIKLTDYFNKYKNHLNQIDTNRLNKNPLRILDSKEPKMQTILYNAPSITDSLDITDKQEFNKLCDHLCKIGINFTISKTLVRGLDYYNGFVFEFIADELGSQNALLSGGRYDGLINAMYNKNIPAAGFAGGVERLLTMIHKNHANKLKFLLILENGVDFATGNKISYYLRNNIQLKIDQYYDISIKKAMHKANKNNFDFCIIKQKNMEKIILKKMSTGKEKIVNLEYLEVFKYHNTNFH